MPTGTPLADRIAVGELFAHLANMLDEARHDDAHTVYTDDVLVHSPRGGELRGIEEVTAFLRQSQPDGEHTQHVHSDVLVTVDGDRAEASANQLVYFYRPDEPPHRTSGLRLNYTATRTQKGWRFSEARLTLAWARS